MVELHDERDLVRVLPRHRPEHAERRSDRVAAPVDRQLHDLLGIEVVGVRREAGARGVLDSLVDREDRHVTGARQAPGVEDPLQAAERPVVAVGERVDPVDEVGTGGVQPLRRDAGGFVLQQVVGVVAEQVEDFAVHIVRSGEDSTWLRDRDDAGGHRSETCAFRRPSAKGAARAQPASRSGGIAGQIGAEDPAVDVPDGDEQRRDDRTEDEADGAEQEQPAERADQHQEVGHLRVLPDQPRPHEVVDRADHGETPDGQTERRDGVPGREQPDHGRHPDEPAADRRDDRQDRHHGAPEGGRGDAGHREAERRRARPARRRSPASP